MILTAADCSDSVRDAVRGQTEGKKHVYLDVLLDVSTLSLAIGANGVQVIALPGRSGLADKIKILLLENNGVSSAEGRVALEQN